MRFFIFKILNNNYYYDISKKKVKKWTLTESCLNLERPSPPFKEEKERMKFSAVSIIVN